MKRRFQTTFFTTLVVFLLTVFPVSVHAQKGGGKKGGGGGGGGEPKQTIFYCEDGIAVYGIDEYGGSQTFIDGPHLAHAVPSALVYGSDPLLDRWWITVAESEPSINEIFAVHPGRSKYVQLTNFAEDNRSLQPRASKHVRLSTDGQDSFFSFISFSSLGGNDRQLHRVNIPLAILEFLIEDSVWTPLRISSQDVETVWYDGPGAPDDTGFIQLRDDYDWSPSGTQIALKTWETVTFTEGIREIKRYDITTDVLSTVASFDHPSFESLRWAPETSPVADSLLFLERGVKLVDSSGLSDPQLVLETSSKQEYYEPIWSPSGEAFVVRSSKRSKGPFSFTWTHSIDIANLSGQTTSVVGSSETAKVPMGWVNNQTALGYAP